MFYILPKLSQFWKVFAVLAAATLRSLLLVGDSGLDGRISVALWVARWSMWVNCRARRRNRQFASPKSPSSDSEVDSKLVNAYEARVKYRRISSEVTWASKIATSPLMGLHHADGPCSAFRLALLEAGGCLRA